MSEREKERWNVWLTVYMEAKSKGLTFAHDYAKDAVGEWDEMFPDGDDEETLSTGKKFELTTGHVEHDGRLFIVSNKRIPGPPERRVITHPNHVRGLRFSENDTVIWMYQWATALSLSDSEAMVENFEFAFVNGRPHQFGEVPGRLK